MDIIDFWFPTDGYQKFWFDQSVDEYIRKNYLTYLNFYEKVDLNLDILSDQDILKIIILLDQFSRNIYRNKDFRVNDKKAFHISKYFFDNRNWKNKKINQLIFYIMPYRHNESSKNYEFIFDTFSKIDLDKLSILDKKLFNKFINVTKKKFNYFMSVS